MKQQTKRVPEPIRVLLMLAWLVALAGCAPGLPVVRSVPSPTVLPVGSTLPSEGACRGKVHLSGWEPRPDNDAANHRIPSAAQLASLTPWNEQQGMDARADALRRRVTGDYTGTTDEISQWTACKWGIDPNIVRAQAVAESGWHQNFAGDWTSDLSRCPPGVATDRGGCYQSYGILQIMYYYHQSTWPMSRDDTAFTADYAYGRMRACYEGWMVYLSQFPPIAGYPAYHAGDIWGCVGFWYSGRWYTAGAITYVTSVKAHYAAQDWLAF